MLVAAVVLAAPATAVPSDLADDRLPWGETPPAKLARNAEPNQVPHDPILIDGDANFTAANGVTRGSGTASDPYVVEGWSVASGTEAAIYVRNTRAHFEVRNVSIAGAYNAVRLENITNGRVDESVLVDVGYGFDIRDSAGPITLDGNQIQARFEGVRISHVQAANVSRNNLSALLAIIVEWSNATLVEANSFESGVADAISVSESEDARIVANNVSAVEEGISLVRAHRARIEANILIANGMGMFVRDSRAVVVRGNTISASPPSDYRGDGLRFLDSPDAVITENVVTSNSAEGILLRASPGANVHANVVTGNGREGILLDHSDGASLANNTVSHNGWGIHLAASRNATLAGNLFVNNGILLDGDLIEHYSTHVIAEDNSVEGLPIYYDPHCGNLQIDRVALGQLLLVNCDSLEVRNVTLSRTDVGIEAMQAGRVTVRDTKFQDLAIGALVRNVQAFEFRNNTVLGSGPAGLRVSGGSWANVTGNTIDGCVPIAYDQCDGVDIQGVAEVVVADNSIHGNRDGLSVADARSVTVLRNNISGNGLGGVIGLSGNVRLEGNVLENTIGYVVSHAANLSIRGNRVRGQGGVGLEIYLVTNLTMEGNAILEAGSTTGRPGIYAEVTNATIRRNSVSSSPEGLQLYNSRNVLVEENDFVGDQGGAFFLGLTNVTFARNSVTSSAGYAICSVSVGLSVYHNNLRSTVPTCFGATTGVTWDAGYPDGGNYWSVYTGSDNCSGPAQDVCPDPDGIGDMPFPVKGTDVDRYPLMMARPDTAAPTVYLAHPYADEMFESPNILASGIALDTGGSGLARVEVRLNGGPWLVASGGSSWSRALTLDRQVNLVEARAWDISGNPSEVQAATAHIPLPNTAPAAAFTTTPTQGGLTTIFVFDASTSTDRDDPTSALLVRWDWDGDGVWDTSWSGVKTAEHRYPAPGSYTVRLEVNDTGGLTDMAETAILVDGPNVAPGAAFSATPTTGDITTVFVFDASACSDAEDPTAALLVRWDWEGDGFWDTSWSNAKTAEHQYAAPGSYTVRLEAMDTGGLSDFAETPILVEDRDLTPPILQHVPPASAKVGAPIRILVNVTDDSSVDEVTLYFAVTKNGESPGGFTSVVMTALGGGSYEGWIPAPQSEGFIDYYLSATDTTGNIARYPTSGTLRVEIIADSTQTGAGLEPVLLIALILPLAAVGIGVAVAVRRRRSRAGNR